MGDRAPHTAFGKRLRAEMDRQQVSVRELARRVNPRDPEGSRRTIARWLTPDSSAAVNPSRARVRAVASALGVEPSSLVDEEDSEMPLSRDEAAHLVSLLGKALGVRA